LFDTGVRSLDLSGNEIEGPSLEQVDAFLAHLSNSKKHRIGAKANRSMTQRTVLYEPLHFFLSFSSSSQVGNRLKQASNVTILNLSENKIDQGIHHIAPFLPELYVLDLSFNQMTAEGISVLVHELDKSNCRLRSLNLRGNQIGDEGALLLAGKSQSGRA
jgi:Leucine-rich repeat (LRR) protein